MGYATEFLLHLTRVSVPHDVVEHHVAADPWMMNGARELRACTYSARKSIHH
jgi:hypothetical protein